MLVVGAGPAGMYATRELLLRTTAEVTLVDRLDQVGGLVRYGVAPDHPSTKQIVQVFERILHHRRVRWMPGTDARELPGVAAGGSSGARRGPVDGFDAVIHAVGARRSRRLGIPGEDAACTAEDFVAWYNGRPGAVAPAELAGPRAVIVGNGNVALDVARILLSDERRLRGMDAPLDVKRRLAASGIKEVVLLGRRGPQDAAYTESALQELRSAVGDRVQLRHHARPTAWTSEGLTLDSGESIAAGNLFTAVGFEGRPIDGLPFDPDAGSSRTSAAPSSTGPVTTWRAGSNAALAAGSA